MNTRPPWLEGHMGATVRPGENREGEEQPGMYPGLLSMS